MGQVFKFATSYIQDLESIKKLNLMLKDVIKKKYQLKNLSRKKNNIKNEDKI
jgi:phenylacetate-coenzyme A ligase PaaK-like adenylate-forming protein